MSRFVCTVAAALATTVLLNFALTSARAQGRAAATANTRLRYTSPQTATFLKEQLKKLGALSASSRDRSKSAETQEQLPPVLPAAFGESSLALFNGGSSSPSLPALPPVQPQASVFQDNLPPSPEDATAPPAEATAGTGSLTDADRKEIEAIIADYLKKKDTAKKKSDDEKKRADEEKKKLDEESKKSEEVANDHGIGFIDDGHWDTVDLEYDNSLQCLIDSLSLLKGKKWYDRLSIRGYSQLRFARTLETEEGVPNMFGDRSVNGNAENFSLRRARLVLSGDVTDHLYVYIQPDFASTPQNSTTSTFFVQLRDWYADVHLDREKVHRLRMGLSKIPYGWENLQSSQNRIPLDRTDAMNTAVAPNERDLGVIYYWTPVRYQKLFKALVDGGLKGSGNYGIFGIGAYNGQGGAVPEANLDLHMVARLTCPVKLPCGQVFEMGIQGVRGHYVVTGSRISPLGVGALAFPNGTNNSSSADFSGILEQRVAASFVWFPQPFGFQAEWQVGEGPGLNDEQTEVVRRHLYGGYVMGMYRHETDRCGIFTPYCRYQQYTGGYRNIANAPYGHQRQIDIGVEWQMRKEMELVLEYSQVNCPNFAARGTVGDRSYTEFEGNVLRLQFQFNY